MDAQDFLRQVKSQPFSVLSDLVYQYITDAIVDVRYAPGSKINTKQIAEELAISRTPVRTALERLVGENLVEQVGEKGFKVCQVDWRDCMALYDIREMIEGNAAYIAANTVTDAQIEQLKQTILMAKQAQAQHNILAISEADNRFHELIVRFSGNSYLINMYNSLKIWIRRYQRALIAIGKYDAEAHSADRHTVIYRALKSHYSLVAKTEMMNHLHSIYRMLFNGGLVVHLPEESEG